MKRENRTFVTDEKQWPLLKDEFMKGPWVRVIDFLVDKKLVDLSGRVNVDNASDVFQTRGWSKEKLELMSIETAKRVKEKNALIAVRESQKLIEKNNERIKRDRKRIRNKQAKIAKKMLKMGAEALKEFKPKNIEEARKLISTALTHQRAILTMDQEGGAASKLTQVNNFNLPKTRFDELLDEQDAEGLIKLIGAVRRERARRVGEGNVVEIQGEGEQTGT